MDKWNKEDVDNAIKNSAEQMLEEASKQYAANAHGKELYASNSFIAGAEWERKRAEKLVEAASELFSKYEPFLTLEKNLFKALEEYKGADNGK